MDFANTGMPFTPAERSDQSEITLDKMNGLLLTLGGRRMEKQEELDPVLEPYLNPNRRYHTLEYIQTYMGLPDVPDMLLERIKELPYFDDLEMAEKRAFLDELYATIELGGKGHDVVYKQVDAPTLEEAREGKTDPAKETAWTPGIRELIGETVDYRFEAKNSSGDSHNRNDEMTYYSTIAEKGHTDKVTRIVARLFGMDVEKDRINGELSLEQGSNEFDSAMVVAKLLERQIRAKTNKGNGEELEPREYERIMAVAAMVAGTTCFFPATAEEAKAAVEAGDESCRRFIPYEDGFSGWLADQMSIIGKEEIGEQIPWGRINAYGLLGCQLYNRDTGPFFADDFSHLVHGAHELRIQELPKLRPGQEGVKKDGVFTPNDLMDIAEINRSSPALYTSIMLGNFPFTIPHFYCERDEKGKIIAGKDSYPPQEIWEKAKEQTHINARKSLFYLVCKKVGASITAALAHGVKEEQEIGEEEKPPIQLTDFVEGRIQRASAVPNKEKTHRLLSGEATVTLDIKDEKKQITLAKGEVADVYDKLMYGRGKSHKKLNDFEIDRSPFAALSLAFVGPEKMGELFNSVTGKSAFVSGAEGRQEAVEFLARTRRVMEAERRFVMDKNGQDRRNGVDIIADELGYIAEVKGFTERAGKLKDFRDEVKEFSNLTRDKVVLIG